MNILSLFDGISCGYLALQRANLPITNYFASEIDKHAIQISQNNFSNIIRLGDVCDWRKWELPKIDLLIGGSPCQGFSFAGKQLNFDDPRSKLFFEFVDCLKHFQPKYFFLENVMMNKQSENIITDILGVLPIKINSAILSAQSRRRLYWCNWSITKPIDRNIKAKDIIEWNYKEPNSETWHNWWSKNQIKQLSKKYSCIINDVPKSICMTARQISSWTGNLVKISDQLLRFITPLEAERLQTLSDNFTSGLSDSARYKAIGNCWTVDVVSHMFKFINSVNGKTKPINKQISF